MRNMDRKIQSLEKGFGQLLSNLGIKEKFILYKLYYDWERVVGPSISEYAKLINIQPPIITVEVSMSTWMQEIKIRTPHILESIRAYYGDNRIEQIHVRLKQQGMRVNKDTYTKIPVYEEALMRESHLIKKEIPLKDNDKEHIKRITDKIDNPNIAAFAIKILENVKKKELYMKQKGFHQCPFCNTWIDDPIKGPCFVCIDREKQKNYRKIINSIKREFEKYPYLKYDEMKEILPYCELDAFMKAKREIIYFYLDRIYKGSTDPKDLYYATMLITMKRKEELSFEYIVNLTNKYRNKYK